MLTISSLSREFVKVPVTATEDGAAVNPTADVVQMAFPANGVKPVSGDWKTAEWETAGARYFARCLVGPSGTVTLAAGLFEVWVKVTSNPEAPAKKAGKLKVV